MRPVRALGASLVIGALALASACGGSGDSDKGKDKDRAAGGGPVVVQAANGSVTIPATPRHIVSLSPTHTETLFAIGAGKQVTAVDDLSNYPADAPRTKLSGFQPNAEAIIATKPDLVVLSNDMDGIVEALSKVKIPVLLEPAATKLDEAYDEIQDLGKATGHSAEAAKLTERMRADIRQTVATAKSAGGGGLSYYHELDNQLHSVTSKTFIGQVYGLFGLVNIADGAEKAAGGYPQLSQEYLLRRDPNMIFLADTKCCGQSSVAVGKRPGWSALTAVKKQNTVELDDDVASRWGPRLPEFVKAIAAAVQKASAAK
ncbi:ABC transporter substrate-binding protein [Actinomadura logoneensis]|uniref:ABC transporter substrate-binding protein n=1 Tax=Actinomadura logoneensis TaxID=2293572 RepID=A0A372J8V1_9ACTN|nr:ABC transporter substrate-binding protein [Actinomadura logoneensis]RFU36422.1 ABC transporter substrate-binding protein [Actinomadura logoneensis]